jgi:hypothetical protein
VRDVEDFMIIPRRIQNSEPTGQVWDKDSYLQEAEIRFPPAEVAFIQQLLDDVVDRGIKHGWGTWKTPGVSGHYRVAGIDTTVWIMNLSKASLELRLLWIAKSLKDGGYDFSRLEKAAGLLQGIAGAKLKEAATKDWKGALFLPLNDIVPEHIGDVMSAIGVIVDP